MSDVIKGANVLNEKVVVGPKRKAEDLEREDPVEVAEKKAREILSKAREEAEKILNQARTNAKMVEEKAKNNGYTSGFEKGMEEVRKKLEEVEKFVRILKEKEDQFLDDLKEAMVELTIATVKEIVLSEVERGNVENKVQRALDAVKSSKKVTVKLSESAPAQFVEKLSSMDRIQVVPVPSFGKLDIQVEADFGTLDLRVDSQLELFERLVRKAFGKA